MRTELMLEAGAVLAVIAMAIVYGPAAGWASVVLFGLGAIAMNVYRRRRPTG